MPAPGARKLHERVAGEVAVILSDPALIPSTRSCKLLWLKQTSSPLRYR